MMIPKGVPPKAKYRRWEALRWFVLERERYALFYAVLCGMIQAVPAQSPPRAFRELLYRDLLMYRRFHDPQGREMLGVFPTTGRNMGSALCFSLFSKQIEQFFDHRVVEEHDAVRDRIAEELRGAGYSVKTEVDVEYSRQEKKRRVKKQARWDVLVADRYVIEIETGSNLGSRVKSHIESCLAQRRDISLHVPRIADEEPLPIMEGGVLRYPLSGARDHRSLAARYINFLTQITWRTLLQARRLPEISIDFCYDGELVRSVEIHRGRIVMPLDTCSAWLQRFFEIPVQDEHLGEDISEIIFDRQQLRTVALSEYFRDTAP